ncbi:transporter substrate-binding domain-containing protein [Pseudomonas mangrovi]|uniref:Uncharacterized protein n=1 Tax=Pseudomonas mangrovi TaxID=2161748 RepID=A0A2T5P6X0_9PSED|nr:transporter substrate-binding domain-containing protein [Pseudomonas mangrovi]PTU73454.1 hypothetical protein DBO85_14095 [Pseudomonas mangrovi]
MLKTLAIGLGCLLALPALAAAPAAVPTNIRLDTSQEPPYQMLVDGQLGGLAVEVVDCIFERLQQPHSIELTSLNRARLNVRQQLAEGFFSAAPDPQSDAYAELSAPLLIEKWYWYARDAQVLNRQPWEGELRIGGVLGSNSLAWLEMRGIKVTQTVSRHEQLVKLLERGRIDLFLADQQVMRSVAADVQPPLHQRFARYTPLGVYFAREFLDQHPGFLKAFNRQVQDCAKPGAPLEEPEQRLLRQLAAHHLQRWGKHQLLLAALQEPRPALEQDSIIALDRQWVAAREQGQSTLLGERIASHPASAYLRQVQQRYAPLFGEIFIADEQGLVVAMSQPTSDYWQGDEAKFLQTRGLAEGEAVIEALSYDASSQSFLVQLHLPLFDAGGRTRLGTLTIGMNIEAVFAQSGP